MDNLPVYSYPDEVARKWKSERDMLEAALKTALYDLERIESADWTAEQMRLGAKSGAYIARQALKALELK